MDELPGLSPSDGSGATTDHVDYTLTLKQVPEVFSRMRRQAPSERSLQRYCSAENPPFKAVKIRTSYGQEWLLNEPSLNAYVETLPVDADFSPAPSGVAGAAGDADSTRLPETPQNETNDGVALHERRTLAEVLIENARLMSAVEGRDQLIATMLDDKTFLREELREHRKNRDDIKSLANKMLETLEAMALGARTLRHGAASDGGISAVVRNDVDNDQPNVSDTGTASQPT